MLDRERTALLVVDVQEGFRKAIPDFEAVARKTATLVEGARWLHLPVIVTEQYPKGLGSTAKEVGLQNEPVLEKVVFAASRADGFDLGGRDQVIVCGIEAHVCVYQTVQDLLYSPLQPEDIHVAVDAVSSRDALNKEVALRSFENDDVRLSTVEMALLELCEQAGTPEFKAIQGLIK